MLLLDRFGFNNGKTMVDGLDGEKTPGTWEGGDFATIVHQLKLLGFNAVRLPFLFGDLYTQPPQVSAGCAHMQLALLTSSCGGRFPRQLTRQV
jgi:hypothetical protein